MNQHQTAHYIEKTGAKWEYIAKDKDGNPDKGAHWVDPVSAGDLPQPYIQQGFLIRLWLDPITRLPSHLEPYRPDARDPGDGYRVPAKQDSCNQPHEWWNGDEWGSSLIEKGIFERLACDYRLPASVPFPDEAEVLADYVEPEVKLASREESLEAGAAVREQHDEAFQKLAEHERLEARITELESQLARFQWRSPSQKPTAEDCDENGRVFIDDSELGVFHVNPKDFHAFKVVAWMPAPKPPVESDCQRIIRQRGLTEEEVRIIRETK